MTEPVQLSVFGVSPQKKAAFNIYHDESGTDLEHDRFQLHGVLIVPTCQIQNVVQLLRTSREGYTGQIHFVELRDKTTSPKAKVAARWLNLFFTNLSNYCFYKCMIVDMHSPNLGQSKSVYPHLIYNYASMLAVYGGIVWCLKKYDQVTLSIFSEAMTRAKVDNFEIYLPREVAKRAGKNKHCPQPIIPTEKVTLVNGNPHKVEADMADHCELIQLTDILTGAISEAINAKASQKVKIDLGKLAARWIGDTRVPPWLQEKRLHRRFSVSCYVGKGKYYNVRLSILSRNQLSF